MIIEIKKSLRYGKAAFCKCDYCGKNFKRKLSLVSRSKHHFCNNECNGKYFRGKNNVNYQRTFSKATLKKMSIAKKKIRGKAHPMYGVHRYGEDNPNWKGGKVKDGQGYVYIYSPNHPNKSNRNYVYEHKLVMEKHLGRYLKPEEEIHHINEIKDDNRIENLVLFANKGEHMNYHKNFNKVKEQL